MELYRHGNKNTTLFTVAGEFTLRYNEAAADRPVGVEGCLRALTGALFSHSSPLIENHRAGLVLVDKNALGLC